MQPHPNIKQPIYFLIFLNSIVMKKITFLTVALATLFVGNVFAQAEFDFSKATNYHLIYLDEETAAANINAADITSDCRPDDTTRFLYVWENTYTGQTAMGPNSNGVPGAYLSFTVNNVGWSGFGFVNTAGCKFNAIDDSYRFHIAMKSISNDSHVIIIGDEDAGEVAKMTIGATPFNDGGKIYEVLTDISRDGEWNAIDVSCADLHAYSATGKFGYSNPDFTGNIFSFLSGAREGADIDLDAIFFYKPVDGAVKGVKNANVNIFSTNRTIQVLGGEGLAVYSITGKLVKETKGTIVGTENLPAGIYLAKCGAKVVKVVVK